MSYITLDALRIASPCEAPWSGMKGNDRVRHCEHCEKKVYNLSMLTRAEANALIQEKEGKLCVSLYRRSDGTVLTADCPVGLRALRRSYIKARVKMVAAIVSLWAVINGCSTQTSAVNDTSTSAKDPSGEWNAMIMGEVAFYVPEPDSTHQIKQDTIKN